jgi:hypothetical protein
MNTLPDELQTCIFDLAVNKNKYLQLKEFMSKGVGVDTAWFFDDFTFVLFRNTIMQELIVDFPSIRPHRYILNHFISYFERPLYYQRVICAVWKLYIELDPERKASHVKDVVMRIITNVCIDYFIMCYYSETHTQNSGITEHEHNSVYEWITKKPEVCTILDTLVRKVYTSSNPMEMIENYFSDEIE